VLGWTSGFVAAGIACACASAGAACPPPGQTQASLQALKASRWSWSAVDAAAGAASQAHPSAAPAVDAARRHGLAIALLDCLGYPDPVVRDGLAFDALQTWMRGGLLDEATVREIERRLLAVVARPADPDGFEQPFAALVLAEVARVDRLRPFLSPDERAMLVTQAARYLAGVRDYRGFDARDGWRHGVAHGADWVLQLALNPALDQPMAEALLGAVASQVLPAGEQFWRFGEAERLMAPVVYLGRRTWWTAADWQAWFDALLARRAQAPMSLNLAQRHNLVAFLSALYVALQESTDSEARARLLPGLRQALRALD